MTFDIEKMLREGATPEEIARKIGEATATAQKKIDAEKAANAAEALKKEKAKVAADALNDFLVVCGVAHKDEKCFTAKDLLDAVNFSIDDFASLFTKKPIFDKYI